MVNTESRIDAALRQIARAEPPCGLERRVLGRLDEPPRGFTAVYSISAIAIAASLAVAVLAFGPLTAEIGSRHSSAALALHVTSPAKGAFGAASAVNVPSVPLPLAAAPVNQGRGHARTGRAILPAGSRSRHAAGVAVRSDGARTVVLGQPIRMTPAAISAASLATATHR
jgi:hypothetical protein